MATARKEVVTPAQEPKNASELFIKAFENEGVGSSMACLAKRIWIF